MRIDAAVLRVGDLARSLAFYRDRFGMVPLPSGADRARLAFPADASAEAARPTCLELVQAARPGIGYTQSRDDLYWKIGVTVADVDLARARLEAAGVAVGRPSQFGDIGYLCHLADPDGFVIELLQHRFAENHAPVPPDEDHPLGAPGTLGQITLRIVDPGPALAFYGERLGLTLLSRQPVPQHGFTLYFLANTDETPPVPDLEAVGNREWLWQRPYTTLELQHVRGTETGGRGYRLGDRAGPGFDGLVFEPDAGALDPDATLRDPDGTPIRLSR